MARQALKRDSATRKHAFSQLSGVRTKGAVRCEAFSARSGTKFNDPTKRTWLAAVRSSAFGAAIIDKEPSSREKTMPNIVRAALIAAIVGAFCPMAFAQSASQAAPMANPPRTSDGRPDLQGIWTNQSITSLTRSPKIKTVVLSPKEAAELESQFVWNVNTENQRGATDDSKPHPELGSVGGGVNAFWMDYGRHYATVKGEIRSSWLVDPPNGQLPKKVADAAVNADPTKHIIVGSFDGPETRPLGERCLITGGQSGPVMRNGPYNNNYQFVQTPNFVVMEAEMIHDTRIIPLVKDKAAVRHRTDGTKPWFGDSVGWYEGNTLVVETTDVNPNQQALMSSTGKLTERFTRWSEDEILYEFQVDDPVLYTQTWKGEMTFRKSQEHLYEYACHEANYAMKDILSGARVLESQGKVVANNAAGE
jgi:hypothetical protein